MTFQQDKEKQLSKTDLSSIGSWDKKIVSLCNKLNKNKKYYTTSSCAGRVVLIKGLDEKAEDVFLFRTHDKIKFDEIKKAIEKALKDYNKLIYFQQTPCILHVGCDSLESAQILVDKAKLSGWKHSGIMTTKKRYVVELHSTEKLEFPIANNGEMLVNEDFLKIIVKEANRKLERVWEKIKRLEKMI